MPHSLQPVHDVEHYLRSKRFYTAKRADVCSRVRIGAVMRARHIVELTVCCVLQAAGDTASAVVLHVRNVDNLCEMLRYHAHQVGSCVVFAKEVGFHKHVRIEAHVGIRAFDAHAWRQEVGIVDRVHLAGSTFVDHNIRWLHPHSNQVLHDVRHESVMSFGAIVGAQMDVDPEPPEVIHSGQIVRTSGAVAE